MKMKIEKTMGNRSSHYTISVQPHPTPPWILTQSMENTTLSEKRQTDEVSPSTTETDSMTHLTPSKRLFPPSHIIKSWV